MKNAKISDANVSIQTSRSRGGKKLYTVVLEYLTCLAFPQVVWLLILHVSPHRI